MRTRRATVELLWNGAAVTTKLLGQATEFTYTDPASGEADSLDISIHDRDRRWISAWLPQEGDTLAASIRVQDWTGEGDTRCVPCGVFTLDDFRFSGWPAAGRISAVSVPADTGFRETERTQTWENATLPEIGKEIAARAGIALAWDVEGAPFRLRSAGQTEQTDCDFFMGLCGDYGYAMKVYAHKLVVYDREAYKRKPPAAVLDAGDLLSWSWKTSLAGTYTGGEYAYTDPRTEKEILVKTGEGPRLLKRSGKADGAADAQRRLAAAIAAANHGHTALSATVSGRPELAASQCVQVNGLGRLSGSYFIDNIVHHIGGGYTMDLELSRIE